MAGGTEDQWWWGWWWWWWWGWWVLLSQCNIGPAGAPQELHEPCCGQRGWRVSPHACSGGEGGGEARGLGRPPPCPKPLARAPGRLCWPWLPLAGYRSGWWPFSRDRCGTGWLHPAGWQLHTSPSVADIPGRQSGRARLQNRRRAECRGAGGTAVVAHAHSKRGPGTRPRAAVMVRAAARRRADLLRSVAT